MSHAGARQAVPCRDWARTQQSLRNGQGSRSESFPRGLEQDEAKGKGELKPAQANRKMMVENDGCRRLSRWEMEPVHVFC